MLSFSFGESDSAAVTSLKTPQAVDAAAAAECPVLVVVGEEDRMTAPSGAATLVASFGDRAEVVTIANAGHAMMLERPDAVLDVLIGFLG